MEASAKSGPSVYVKVSGLDAGHLTVLDSMFVAGVDPKTPTTVPSLSFLIQHPSSPPTSRPGNVTNILFDLGIKRDLSSYSAAQQRNIAGWAPVATNPDCSASLRFGANNEGTDDKPLLDPETEIDFVVLSHAHWDHIGTPSDFPRATFIVGSGTLDLMKRGSEPFNPAEEFNPDELPALRTVELPPCLPDDGFRDYYAGSNTPVHTPTPADTQARLPSITKDWAWQHPAGFPRAIDFFNDGSVHIIDCPGHLYGHINLLLRTGPQRYIYLGGDCCHDTRILSGEHEIAEFADGKGGMRSIHVNTELAVRSLEEVRRAADEGLGIGAKVEVVMAHDAGWRERNLRGFWPGRI